MKKEKRCKSCDELIIKDNKVKGEKEYCSDCYKDADLSYQTAEDLGLTKHENK